MKRAFIVSIRMALLTLLLGGVLYPLVVTGVCAVAFPAASRGSLITTSGGAVVGSRLIGQQFTGDTYFHPRPSAAGDGYDATASGASNLGPTSRQLVADVEERVAGVVAANPGAAEGAVPVDFVTSSASGLDPHISPASAALQVARVAKARGVAEAEVQAQVAENTDGRQLGFLGEPRVNVLELNTALDEVLSK